MPVSVMTRPSSVRRLREVKMTLSERLLGEVATSFKIVALWLAIVLNTNILESRILPFL
jgi:hypothetical protein